MSIVSFDVFKNKKRNIFIRNYLSLFLFIVLGNIIIFSANAKELSKNSSKYLFKEQQIRSIQNLVDNFYTLILVENKDTGSRLQKSLTYSKFLTPELNNKIIKAEQLEESAFKVTPKGDKPFYWEGSVFTGLYEGPTQFNIDTIKFTNTTLNKAQVMIKLIYHPEESTEEPYIWHDTVLLTQYNNQWKIENIQMPKKDSNLLKSLDEFIKNAENFIGYESKK